MIINIYQCLFANFHHLFVITSDNLLTIKMINTHNTIQCQIAIPSKEPKSFDKIIMVTLQICIAGEATCPFKF